jgi:hypothetical protein
MLFMIIEHFRNGDPKPVYARFRESGRLAPEGLKYISSWVTADLKHCYQVMECDDRTPLDQWMAAWGDLVEFEVISVVTSTDAAAAVVAPIVPTTQMELPEAP